MNELVNDNLYETRNNLVKEITLLRDTELNSKADVNRWSIAQVCHHLVLVEEATIKAITWDTFIKEGIGEKLDDIKEEIMAKEKYLESGVRLKSGHSLK